MLVWAESAPHAEPKSRAAGVRRRVSLRTKSDIGFPYLIERSHGLLLCNLDTHSGQQQGRSLYRLGTTLGIWQERTQR